MKGRTEEDCQFGNIPSGKYLDMITKFQIQDSYNLATLVARIIQKCITKGNFFSQGERCTDYANLP